MNQNHVWKTIIKSWMAVLSNCLKLLFCMSKIFVRNIFLKQWLLLLQIACPKSLVYKIFSKYWLTDVLVSTSLQNWLDSTLHILQLNSTTGIQSTLVLSHLKRKYWEQYLTNQNKRIFKLLNGLSSNEDYFIMV